MHKVETKLLQALLLFESANVDVEVFGFKVVRVEVIEIKFVNVEVPIAIIVRANDGFTVEPCDVNIEVEFVADPEAVSVLDPVSNLKTDPVLIEVDSGRVEK
jgi:hypothetical protein